VLWFLYWIATSKTGGKMKWGQVKAVPSSLYQPTSNRCSYDQSAMIPSVIIAALVLKPGQRPISLPHSLR